MIVVNTIIILCILIFVHELGHLAAAKLSKVRVNEFAIGMGPAFFKRQWGETQYSLRVFPIGGFCALEGEDEDSEDSRSMNNKPAYIRAFVLASGSLMNVILAILIMSAIIFYAGTSLSTTVKEVGAESPALSAGILPGDKIVEIDGADISEWGDILREITGSPNDRLSIVVIRNGERIPVLTEVAKAEDGRKIIGIIPEVKRNPLTALALGTKASYDMIVNMANILRQLFTGDVPVSGMSGPVGIAGIIDEFAKAGFRPLLYLVALISLNLAIINMLPFPALDGGRLVFLVIRKITGRAVTDSMEAKIHLVGMALLLLLMVYVTWNDIMRLINGAQG